MFPHVQIIDLSATGTYSGDTSFGMESHISLIFIQAPLSSNDVVKSIAQTHHLGTKSPYMILDLMA